MDFAAYHLLTRAAAPLFALGHALRGRDAQPCPAPAPRREAMPVWVHVPGPAELDAAHALIGRLLAQGVPVLLTHARRAAWRRAAHCHAAAAARGQLRQAWSPAPGLPAALAFLALHQPRCVLLVRRGARPCLLRATEALGTPVLLLDASMDETTAWAMRLAGRVMRDCLGALYATHARTAADADRLALAGARRLRVSGSLAAPAGRAVELAMSAWPGASVRRREVQPEPGAAQRAFGT